MTAPGPQTGPVDPPTERLPPLPAAPRPARDPWRRLRAQAPALAVAAVVVLGFVRIAEQHWRQGTTALGLALLLGALLRALCSDAAVGVLAVRGRRVDVVLYAAFGLVVVLVSLTITGGPLTSR